ncbi:hypothetical protein F383_37440 [Gossypium arboreum]|uniref:Uncharacterized protein n=1 Tax=Gossypium arboreum TaxID=29729 RepID=A0A0B0MEX8_GOSAR|nr:hypothetical protein F383_37440 [Gossypium arboreum]
MGESFQDIEIRSSSDCDFRFIPVIFRLGISYCKDILPVFTPV